MIGGSMDYFDVVKSIMAKDRVGKGERVLAKLTGTPHESTWNEIIELGCRNAKLMREVLEINALVNAKQVIFLSEMKKLSELAESAEDRGKFLAVRYDNEGNMVLAEIPPKKKSNSWPDFLGGL
jgi:hypothetical protein